MRMARIPQGASLIENPVSKAPGFRLENVFVMAGVPKIMQAMLESLKSQLERGTPVQSTTVTAFIGEGDLANPPPPHRSVVLVVEDNDAVRDVAATMIADLGVETLTASNGSEALHILETRKDIDLVLSDVIMAGGMNGPELAARALKMRPELKLLFMSGYAPGSVRQMQNLPDAIDLVNKPFTRTDLTSKVMRALAA
jgi:CheY-like chemotaxis protein